MDAHKDAGENAAKTEPGAIRKDSRMDRGFEKLKHLVLVDKEKILSFEELYCKESEDLGKKVHLKEGWISTGTGGEPWVNFTPLDRFGLALSGGGIRSATFNLGLLQSLDQLGVLKHLDYLATVSGGGYIGGFWTAWLRRNKPTKTGGRIFPIADGRTTGESSEVRHLREFSRFLLPRFRVMGTEFWSIVMTVLGGLLPSLTSALAVLILMWFGWVMILGCLHARPGNEWHVWAMLIFVSCEFIRSEFPWQRAGQIQNDKPQSRWSQYKSEHNVGDISGYVFGALVGSTLIAIAWLLWRTALPHSSDLSPLKTMLSLRTEGFESLQHPKVGFKPALVIGTVTLVVLIIRALIARWFYSPGGISFLAGFERAATRMLRLAVFSLALATLWWLAGLILASEDQASVKFVGTGAAFSTALFLWARKWLSEPPDATHGGDLRKVALGWLKRATPKVLALITWVMLFLLVGVAWECWLQTHETPASLSFWWLPGGSVLLVGLMVVFFDPERMGMHELYRSRISRCYLGASNQDRSVGLTAAVRAAHNRSMSELPDDDMKLPEMAEHSGTTKPLHLVCTAANDLAGDPVGTLYRGAKSAVLSANGISLGDKTAKLEQLRFSSALTASAAAFNSQMGRFSIDLGPAVTFLMTAFNLRLGLWVPHPDSFRNRQIRLPGSLFFLELLGLSKADGRFLLLSDGGHFENFGLYELVRRHCRYIIVSDCGSDPETAFDDLANVLRRVREDFGVEVELDVSRLRPGSDGLAGQHAAVGTIHYDGLGGMDKGTMLFIKPTITGDEPPDVLQYQTRNNSFPQESTVNQFYDEPQWESYRRLGEHTGRTVFEFLDRPATETSDTVDNIFREARSFWYPMPESLSDSFIEMSARCAEFEESLTSEGPMLLRREFFPEASELTKPEKPKDQDSEAGQKPKPLAALDEEIHILGFLIRIIQIMEDVWVSGDFERYWSHPLNEGWMNYFHRWASTPSFRRWWPVLAPIFSPGFRAFIQERFSVGSVDPQVLQPGTQAPATAQLRLSLLNGTENYKNSNAWHCFLQYRPGIILAGKKIFGYELQLLNRDGVPHGPGLWVGFVLVNESPGDAPNTAEWRAEDFFVPPMLHGGKIVSNLLDAVIRYYETHPDRHVGRLKLIFDDGQPRTAKALHPRESQGLAPAARYDRVREIEFYKSRGFQYEQRENPKTGARSLYRNLHSK
jgi:hypothetical protein